MEPRARRGLSPARITLGSVVLVGQTARLFAVAGPTAGRWIAGGTVAMLACLVLVEWRRPAWFTPDPSSWAGRDRPLATVVLALLVGVGLMLIPVTDREREPAAERVAVPQLVEQGLIVFGGALTVGAVWRLAAHASRRSKADPGATAACRRRGP